MDTVREVADTAAMILVFIAAFLFQAWRFRPRRRWTYSQNKRG